MTVELHHGDCLELMKNIPDGSVDLVLTDPPYGTTACKWDSVIPFEPMWEQLKRIVKRGGAIVLFGSEPFSSLLRASNIDWYKYDWVWNKKKSGNIFLAGVQPMKVHENISVFFQAPTDDTTNAYQSLKEYFQYEKKKSGLNSKQIKELLGNYMASHYFTNGSQFCIPSEENYKKLQSTGFFQVPFEEIKKQYKEDCQNTYNPIKTKRESVKTSKNYGTGETMGGNRKKEEKVYSYTHKNPISILEFSNAVQKGKVHPTQKPTALLEYLIRTYTNEGETVLDFTMGSGSTGVACVDTNRNFIGIELDDKYFAIAEQRINRHKEQNIFYEV